MVKKSSSPVFDRRCTRRTVGERERDRERERARERRGGAE